MFIISDLYRRFTIRFKLTFSALFIMLAVALSVVGIFSSFLSRLIIEDQVKSDLFSYEKGAERFLQIHRELEDHLSTLSSNNHLFDILSRSYNGNRTEDIKEQVDELDRISSALYINNNSLGEIMLVGSNGFIYHYRQYEEGTYAGHSEDYLKSLEGILTLGEGGENRYHPQILRSGAVGIDLYGLDQIASLLGGKIYLVRQLDAGLVILTYNLDFLSRYFTDSSASFRVGLFSHEGTAVWSRGTEDPSRIYAMRDEGYHFHLGEEGDFLITESLMEPFGYRFIGVRDRRIIVERIGRSNLIAVAVLASALIYTFFISRISSEQISLPLKQLAAGMNRKTRDDSPPLVGDDRGMLTNRLIRFFTLSVLLPGIIFLLFSFQMYQGIYRRELLESTAESLEVKKNILDYDLNSYGMKLIGTIFNKGFQDLLYSMNKEGVDREKLQQLALLLENRYALYREPVNLSYYTDPETPVFSLASSGLESVLSSDPALLNEIENSSGELILLGLVKNLYGDNQVSLARKINYIGATSYPRVGYVKVDIPMDYIEESLKGEIQPLYDLLLIQDGEGRLDVISSLSVREKRTSLQSRLDDKNYHIAVSRSSSYPLTYYSLISRSSISNTLGPVRWYAVTTVILMFLIIIAVSFLLSLSLLLPFRRLVNSLEAGIESKRHYFKTQVRGYDEIALLSRQFNYMVEEMNTLIQENFEATLKQKELQILQKEAQFNALQQQINPHFLYNTLDSINWMAYKAGARDVCRMVSALARFFRGVIADEHEISVAEELDHLEQYIYIQKKRFYKKISFSIETDDFISDCRMVKLILQPLVENAVIHGLEGQDGPGHILVKGWLEEEQVCFDVSDDGKGIDRETITGIQASLDNPDEGDFLGLKNVYGRLKMHFGDSVSMKIGSRPGEGTTVSLRFPARQSPVT